MSDETGPFRAPARTPANELVLIAVKNNREAALLIEQGRRLAGRLGAAWIILHVETLDALRAPAGERQSLGETLRAAEFVGGKSARVPANDVARTIAAYARGQGATHVVIGAQRRRVGLLSRRLSLADQIADAADGVCIQVVAPSAEPPARLLAPPDTRPQPVRSYILSLALVAAATVVADSLSAYVANTSLSVVFLTAVLIAATEWGLGPALFVSVLSLISYDLLFLPPVYSLNIGSSEDLTAFAAFAVAALIASRLATRVRDQMHLAARRAAEASDLYQLTRGLAGAGTLQQVAQIVAARASAAVERPVAVLLATSPSAVCAPPLADFAAGDRAVAEACLDAALRGAPEGHARSQGGWHFLPMRTAGSVAGVVGVQDPGRSLELKKQHRLTIIAEQVAIAVDRINLAGDLDRERQRDATDRLHASLLASISHDLRDPLTAILGPAIMLDERWRVLPAAMSAELIHTIREEAERLHLLIDNLLDMARLEGSAFRARLTHNSVSDMVGAALRRTEPLVGALPVRLDIAPALPPLLVDPVLFEQVLFNLVDNAAKHAPPGTELELSAIQADDWVHIQLADSGPGFPPDHIGRVFDKFFHGGATGRRKGAGLGLAICRGFVEAMHGRIVAQNRTGRPGAAIIVSFPVPATAIGAWVGALDG